MKNNALFSQEEIDRLKNTSDPGLRALVDSLLNDAERALAGEGGNLRLLGFAYAYTGDPRYVERARRILRNLAEWAEMKD